MLCAIELMKISFEATLIKSSCNYSIGGISPSTVDMTCVCNICPVTRFYDLVFTNMQKYLALVAPSFPILLCSPPCH